ncbi:hypothetical protein [Acinetobacter baumannii]|uniref:hypothetical protein n=1 Tax=Acinetobacter baumannii TaxID=470 RepID=UPI00244C88CD|nr:hypothetical protein [Acinetobacter baumannii]MDH2644760.1 hypothetical protein [Acinetobacter baumannii]
MIKTPLSTVLGGAFWTPEATVINGAKLSFETVMKKLFANNEQGFAYDPNDLSTMFQDAAGTVPVTGVGQPVGLIRDKSGRNNHAYQTTSASRPILRQNAVTGAYYLELDGSDDFFVTNSIDFTATDKVSLFAGVRKLSDTVSGMLFELSSSIGSYNGVFNVAAPSIGGNPEYVFSSKGTTSAISRATGFVAPISSVVSAIGDILKPRSAIRVNGVVKQEALLSQGTGNFGNYPLYIGRRGGTSVPFNGHLYSLIGIGRLTTDSETIALEKSIAKNVGVTL